MIAPLKTRLGLPMLPNDRNRLRTKEKPAVAERGCPRLFQNAGIRSALNFEVFRRRFSLVRNFLVFDDLPLVETAKPSSLDRRDVDEHIFACRPAAE